MVTPQLHDCNSPTLTSVEERIIYKLSPVLHTSKYLQIVASWSLLGNRRNLYMSEGRNECPFMRGGMKSFTLEKLRAQLKGVFLWHWHWIINPLKRKWIICFSYFHGANFMAHCKAGCEIFPVRFLPHANRSRWRCQLSKRHLS